MRTLGRRIGSGGRLVRRALTGTKLEIRNAWLAVKAAVRQRDGDICRACDAPVDHRASVDRLTAAHVHHIQPRSLGGENSTANCCVLCAECHQRAHASQATRLVIVGNADDTLIFRCQGRTWQTVAIPHRSSSPVSDARQPLSQEHP
jgi:hypothetical protein